MYINIFCLEIGVTELEKLAIKSARSRKENSSSFWF